MRARITSWDEIDEQMEREGKAIKRAMRSVNHGRKNRSEREPKKATEANREHRLSLYDKLCR